MQIIPTLPTRSTVLWALAAVCLRAAPAAALLIDGGGSPATDCLAVFDADVDPSTFDGHKILCTDGDPLCDGDAAEGPNGVCVIPVAVCVNSTADPQCTLNGVASVTVDHAVDNGDPRFDPQFQALQTRIDSAVEPPEVTPDHCSLPTNFTIPIKGPTGNNRCSKGKMKIQLTAESVVLSGSVYSDRDKLKLFCLPAATGGCDPQTLFDSTYDRIQRQIFNSSCAVSACHDSQSQQNGLLLETGASYTNLVDTPPIPPTNPVAAGLGWNRVTPGDPGTSYLFHKITGDLNDDPLLGERMPLGGKKLNGTLREIVELWIQDGAPASGWVNGTY
jgi:hypothetical protein